MSEILQIICASGIFGTIITLIITRVVNGQLDQIKEMQKTKSQNDFLLWTKIDKQGDLVLLMANKMHEAGIINGDLENVKQEYKAADAEYEKHVHKLAAEVLRR